MNKLVTLSILVLIVILVWIWFKQPEKVQLGGGGGRVSSLLGSVEIDEISNLLKNFNP